MSVAESTYGSDKIGLIWGYLFVPGRPGLSISSDEVAERLAVQPADDAAPFLWLHFTLAHAASEPWLRQHLSLPQAFHESLHQSTHHHGASTRVEMADDWVVAVLNDVLFFSSDTSEASTVSLCADRRLLVSARTTALRSVDRLRASVRNGESFRSPAELVAHLLRDQADVLVEIVREVTATVDVIEDKLFRGEAAASRPKLGAMRRRLVRLQRLLAPEPAALFRLLNRPPGWINVDDVRDLRQSAEELAAAVADSVALVERVRLIQEELVALVNEHTGRTLFILTVVTVLALPMTIIPGLLGMNVGGVPLKEHPGGFWFVVAMISLLTALGAVWAFGRRRDI